MDLLTALGGQRKKKEVTIDMLEFDYIERCSDIDELKAIFELLESGKEGKYPDLEAAAERKLLSLLPDNERKKVQLMRQGPTAADIETARHEVLGFERDIAKLDKGLKQISPKKGEKRKLPPVRGGATSTVSSTRAQDHSDAPQRSNANQERIKSYDYAAFEKFDVDKVLQEMDNEEDQKERERTEYAKIQTEEQKRREQRRKKELEALPRGISIAAFSDAEKEVLAQKEKEKGNECFKSKEFEEAMLYYSRSIALWDKSATVYANRALCALKLEQFNRAEEDCTRAIELDPAYVKAWIRKGQVASKRGRYADAIQHFTHALSLDPRSKDVQKALEEAKAKFAEVEGESFDSTGKKNLENRAENFRRVTIIEEDDDEEEEEQPVPLSGDGNRRNPNAADSDSDGYEKISASDCIQTESDEDGEPEPSEPAFTRIPITEHSDDEELSDFEGDSAAEDGDELEDSTDYAAAVASTTVNRASPAVAPKTRQNEKSDAKPCGIQKALQMKEKANASAGQGQIEEAVRLYTEALSILEGTTDSRQLTAEQTQHAAVILTNRAACYLQNEQWEGVINDCERALKYDPQSVKAILRRGLAYEKTGDVDRAVRDLTLLVASHDKSGLPSKISAPPEIYGAAKDALERIKTANTSSSSHARGLADRETISTSKNDSNSIPAAPPSSAPTISKVPILRKEDKEDLLQTHKEKGNDCFKHGRFAEAEECYSRCIELDPEFITGYCNRAMVYIKLERFVDALKDCDKVLEREPGNIKALYRQGVAHMGLKNHTDAEKAFQFVLELESSNKLAQSQLEAVRQLIRAQKAATKKQSQTNPRAEDRSLNTRGDQAVKKNVTFAENVASGGKPSSAQIKERTSNPPSSNTPKKTATVTEKKAVAKDDHSGNAEGKPADQKLKKEHKATDVAARALSALKQKSQPGNVKFTAPRTSYEFERVWQRYGKDAEMFAAYLKIIEPQRYANLFKQSFSAEIMYSIFQAVKSKLAEADTGFSLKILENLTKVNRFGMVVAFMTNEEKLECEEGFKKIRSQLAAAEADTENQMASLDSLEDIYRRTGAFRS